MSIFVTTVAYAMPALSAKTANKDSFSDTIPRQDISYRPFTSKRLCAGLLDCSCYLVGNCTHLVPFGEKDK